MDRRNPLLPCIAGLIWLSTMVVVLLKDLAGTVVTMVNANGGNLDMGNTVRLGVNAQNAS